MSAVFKERKMYSEDAHSSDELENQDCECVNNSIREMYGDNCQQTNHDFDASKDLESDYKLRNYPTVSVSNENSLSASGTANIPSRSPSFEAKSSKTVSHQIGAMSSETLSLSDASKLPQSSADFQQTILLEFKKLHRRMDQLSEEIIPELRNLNQRVARIENQCKSKGTGMPCRPTCLPIKSDQDLDNFEHLPEDEYDDVVRYFEFVTGFNVKETVNNIMKEAVLDQYAMDLTWHGKNDKTPFINTRLSKAIFEALSKNKFFEAPNSKEFQCAVTEALRNSKQRVRNKKEVVSPGHENRKRSYIKIKEEYG